MLGQPLLAAALSSLILLSFVSHGSADNRQAANRFVVHEWGTFTSVVGRGGHPRAWRPLSFESDLPAFVYSVDKGSAWRGGHLRYESKSRTPVTVRMETPVLYFYANQEKTVSVKVDFPEGRMTEWYPQAQLESSGIAWRSFQMLPGANLYFPFDGKENHYYPARATDSSPLRVQTEGRLEQEKFLFYRGIGNFALPVSPKLDGDKLIINNDDPGVAKVIVFESRNGRMGYLVRDVAKGEATLSRPELGPGNGKLNALRREMKALLVANGLYEKEAEAMLETWRDAWFEDGLRVFYVLPRKMTDSILPITIDPQPTELVRVLVGRTELITPEMEADVMAQVGRLDNPLAQAAALKEINKYRRFAAPILEQILEHTSNQNARRKVQKLLQEMAHQS